MPDRPFPSDPHEARTRFWYKRYVIMGIVAACVLVALAILGGGVLRYERKGHDPAASTGHHTVRNSSTGYHAAKHPSTGNRRN